MEPAWRDADDEQLRLETGYMGKLRSLHSSLHQPTWAQATVHDRRTILGLLSTSKAVLSDKAPHLLPHNIEIEQLPHANSASYSR
jgi:hypothetical protein